jgi:hypothetical protein
LSESSKDDNDEFQSVHALSSNDISKSTKAKLSDDCSTRCCDLDGGIGIGWHGTSLGPVHYTQHSGEKTDGKDVVGVCERSIFVVSRIFVQSLTSEESNTGDNTSSDMIPNESLALQDKHLPRFQESYHPNGALSISARARRRRSLGSWMWAKSLLKLW